jgi:hypothetical protein
MAELSQGQQTSAIYWLENFESRRAVFNDPSDPDYVGGLEDEGITGLDAPEVREAAYDHVEAHGGLHGRFWAGRRPVTITSAITPQDAPTIAAREAIMQKIIRASNMLTRDGKLIWFPGDPSIASTTRMNLIPDPSFEYDVVGNIPGDVQSGETPYGFTSVQPWTDVGTSGSYTSRLFEVAAANPVSGTKALRLKGTKDATATERLMQGYTTAGTIPGIVPGRTYSAKMGVYVADAPASSTSAAMQMLLVWHDNNGTSVGTATSSVLAAGTTGAQTFTINGAVAPAGAAGAQLIFRAHSTTVSDVLDFYIDAAQLVAEASAGAYLDGDSANSSWLGERGFSRSVNRPNGRFLTVRRQAGPRFSGAGMRKSCQVSLIAADPRIYSTVQYRAQVAHATDAWIENQGGFSCPAIFRVYGPYNAGTVTIDVLATGVSRQLIWTKGASPEGTAGHAMQADDFRRSLHLDPLTYEPLTGTNRYGSLDFTNGAEWPEILPDARNKIRFDCSGGGTTSATVLDVRWRDAWL